MARVDHLVDSIVALELAERSDRREDHLEGALLVPRQGLCGVDPDRLELFVTVSHRLLSGGHGCDKKPHLESLGQIRVGGPLREPTGAVDCQLELMVSKLCVEVGILGTIERRCLMRLAQTLLTFAPGQQNAEFFERLAKRRMRMLTMIRVLVSARTGNSMGSLACIGRIDSTARKDIDAWCETGCL